MLKRSLMILLLISLILSVSACSQNKTDIIKERGGSSVREIRSTDYAEYRNGS